MQLLLATVTSKIFRDAGRAMVPLRQKTANRGWAGSKAGSVPQTLAEL